MREDGLAFGRLLRDFRLAAGLSQEALAQRARMSAGGVSVLERGMRRSPHRDTVALLAGALELNPQDRARLDAAAIRPSLPRRRRAAAGGDRHNLPFALTRFLGREREEAALRAGLAEQRLVTLTGVGGVGKTRLALESARGLLERFPDGVWLVELAPVTDPRAVAARVSATLGVSQQFETAASDAWIGEIVEKCLLVVLDNCEHVLAGAAAVAQRILERCRFIRILATSREALRIPGERVIRLDPLELPRTRAGEPSNLNELRASPAINLFFDRVRDVAPDFAIAEGDDAAWRTLENICAQLDGMPLAIELAAARMGTMSLETLARALERRFHLIAVGARSAPQRHQTLNALFDWSYGLLGNAERNLFRRLAVFAGGWTLEAAEAVCAGDELASADFLAAHTSLVEKSLVVADMRSAASRYAMLETTHAYALARLNEDDGHSPVAHAHAGYYRDLLRQANATYGKPSLSAWLTPLEPELDNFRAALQWSLADGQDVALGATIAASQHAVLELLSLSAEGARWCEEALATLGTEPDHLLEAPLQLALCTFYANGGYATRAAVAASRAAELYRHLPAGPSIRNLSARGSLSFALSFDAWALGCLGRSGEADATATEAVAVAREAPEPSVRAWALIVKSLTVGANDTGARRALLAEALELGRSMPGSLTFGLALIGCGLSEFDVGDFQRARAYARDAASYYRGSGLGAYLEFTALTLSAHAALAAGNREEAGADAHEALSRAHRASRGDLTTLLQVVARIAAYGGRRRTAAHLIGGADGLLAELDRELSPPTAQLREQTLEAIQADVGQGELATWLAEGRASSVDALIAAAQNETAAASPALPATPQGLRSPQPAAPAPSNDPKVRRPR